MPHILSSTKSLWAIRVLELLMFSLLCDKALPTSLCFRALFCLQILFLRFMLIFVPVFNSCLCQDRVHCPSNCFHSHLQTPALPQFKRSANQYDSEAFSQISGRLPETAFSVQCLRVRLTRSKKSAVWNRARETMKNERCPGQLSKLACIGERLEYVRN